MYIFFALILFLPMLALKRRSDGDTDILDSRSTTCIKGILCIYVMLHNLGLDLNNDALKELICEHAGGVGVGVFFFLSAFGIIRSYQAKGNAYLKKLLLVHLPKMWLVAVFINAITYIFFQKGSYEPLDMWLRILNLDFFNGFRHINRHGWYIATIMALYIAFAIIYFVCSKLRTEKRFIIAAIALALVPILFRLVAKLTHTGVMYTRELPTFVIGCIYATFYDKINAWAKKYFGIGTFICTCLLIIGFLSEEFIATYAAAIIIIFISQKFTYYSSVTFFLGKICIGVYLFLHFSSIVLQPYLANEYLWVLLNAGFIIEAAIAIYGVQYYFDTLIRKIKK